MSGIVLDSSVGNVDDRKRQEIIGVMQKELEAHVTSARARVKKFGDKAILTPDEEFACSAFSGVPIKLVKIPGGGMSAVLTAPHRVLVISGRIVVSPWKAAPEEEQAPPLVPPPVTPRGSPAFLPGKDARLADPRVSRYDGRNLKGFNHLLSP